jgi:hypothetical protein
MKPPIQYRPTQTQGAAEDPKPTGQDINWRERALAAEAKLAQLKQKNLEAVNRHRQRKKNIPPG